MFPSPYVLVACVAAAVCADARRHRRHANTSYSTLTLVQAEVNIPGLPFTELPESGGHVEHRGAERHPAKHNHAELPPIKRAENHDSQRQHSKNHHSKHFHVKSEGHIDHSQTIHDPAKCHSETSPGENSDAETHDKQRPHSKNQHAKDCHANSERHTDRHPAKLLHYANHSSHRHSKCFQAEHTKVDHHAAKRLPPAPPHPKHTHSGRPSVEHPDTQRPRSKHRHAEHSPTQYPADQLPDSEHSDTQHSGSKHSHPEYSNAAHSYTEHNTAGHRESEHYDSEHPDQEYFQSEYCNSQSDSEHRGQEHSHSEHPDRHANTPTYPPHSNYTFTNNSPANHTLPDYNPTDYIPIKQLLPCHTPNQSYTDTTPARQSPAPQQRPSRQLPPMPPDQEILLLVYELAAIADDTIEAKECVEDRLRVLLRALCQCLLPDEAAQCNILTKNTTDHWAVRAMQNKMAAALSKPRKEGQDWALPIVFLLMVLINVGLANLARIYRRRNVNEFPGTEFPVARTFSSL